VSFFSLTTRECSPFVSSSPCLRNLSINMLIRGRVVPTISDNSSCDIFVFDPNKRYRIDAHTSSSLFLTPKWLLGSPSLNKIDHENYQGNDQ
jgi:hypothetical protein